MQPEIRGILETAVYVDDLCAAYGFYHGVLGLERMMGGARLEAYNVAPSQVLLVCLRGACDEDILVNGQRVPGHFSLGPSHFAFRIGSETLDHWIAHLGLHGVALESRVVWPLGGESLYVRDPFENVVELATAGVWPNDPKG